MSTSSICTLGLGAAAVAIVCTHTLGDGHGSATVQVPAVALQDGDVVLRRGTGVWSLLFARVNSRDRRFSHVGVVSRDGKGWRVIHAEADDVGRDGRVRLDQWSEFVAGSPRFAVLRLDDPAAASGVARAALAMHAAHLPFDFSFDLTGSDAVYCSELAWRAIREALGRDPLPVKPVRNGREIVLIESFLLDMADLRLVHLRE